MNLLAQLETLFNEDKEQFVSIKNEKNTMSSHGMVKDLFESVGNTADLKMRNQFGPTLQVKRIHYNDFNDVIEIEV